jgi:dipeptidyl aminopeptidase/acylaminoacyl peptidase
MRFATCWIVLGLMVAPRPSAAQAPDRLTPMDEFQMEYVSDPQISPDGRQIVYVRQFSDVMTDKRYTNLWIVDIDGQHHRPLTTGLVSDHTPRWSPDGSQLAYISDRDGSPQIYRRWMDDGQTARVTQVTAPPSGIAWSPDGRTIAFTMLVPEPPPTVADLPAPPAGATWAAPARVVNRLVYRFNGAGYLKPGYEHLFVVPAEGGTPRQLSSGNYRHGGAGANASDPVWTPDGKFILLSANRHDDFELHPRNTEVYEFAVADGAVRALTNRNGPDDGPAVSPDGRSIAYVGYDDRLQGYQVRKLTVARRDGSEPRVLSAAWDRDVENAAWGSDGKGLYFMSDDGGSTGLYYIGLDGKVRTLLTGLGSSGSSYSGGGAFTIASNGTMALTLKTALNPGDVAVATTANPTPTLVTAVNADVLDGKTLGSVEEFTYESSKDKRRIEGWILTPPGFDPAKKYPLILEIHGGPFANYGERFDFEKQLMAAAGYVVVYVNPRGSTGYGEEFGNLIHHAYPGDDFSDLDAGVSAVVARGYVDPQHLYVTGGSGGGVLTCWMIGHTDRFRAAVTVYPVINWYSFVLTSDIGNWTVDHWFPGFPWDNVQHYESRSLLSVVRNVKTPTMVMIGEADYRTPISESEQYYQALKLRGIESVMVRVPDEPHGIGVRPSHHLAKVQYIIGWFERHR